MKYAFIQHHRRQYPVQRMCMLLSVSTSGFYDWVKRSESMRALRHRRLTGQIQVFFEQSRQTYGAVRICRELKEAGECLGKNTVALLMRKACIIPKTIKRFRVTTDSRNTKAEPNLLAQQFTVGKLNHRWVTDMTFIPTRHGWLYLAIVLDLFSRAVVGWSMSRRMRGELVIDALKMAIMRRNPNEAVLVHSDQGSQYASDEYQQTLREHGMSRRGHCWDNAVAESFFHTLKTELIHHEQYLSPTHARESIFHYIEIFYNRRRRHSHLDYQAPMIYESKYTSP